MISLRFSVIGKPATQGSKRAFIAGNRAIVVEDCKRNRPWRSDVRSACQEAMRIAGWPAPMINQGPVRVRMSFYLARPQGHFGSGKNADKLKPSARQHPTGKPDVVKLARAVEDALKGMAWSDDSQICVEQIDKLYCERGQAEGVLVKIEAF